MTRILRGFRFSAMPQLDRSSSHNLSQVRPARTVHSSKRPSVAWLTLSITGGWLFSTIALPVRAATLLNNSGVVFDQDTTLESSFVESHGAYQSTFGVINLDTKEKTPLLVETRGSDNAESIFKPSTLRSNVGANIDFPGTAGNAVIKPSAQYDFKANQRYVLYLESSYNGRPTGILYSTDVLNPNRERQVQFAGEASDLCASGVSVGWDDTGSKLVRDRQQQDRDFDDFIVQLKSMSCGVGGGEPPSVVAQTPPPPTVGALPPAGGRSSGLFGLLPLAALPFLFGGGDDGDNNPVVPPGIPGGTPGGIPGGNPSVNPGGNPGGTPGGIPGGNPSLNPTVPPICPSGNCEAVPEPLTMLGSGSAIAVAALIERRRKKRK